MPKFMPKYLNLPLIFLAFLLLRMPKAIGSYTGLGQKEPWVSLLQSQLGVQPASKLDVVADSLPLQSFGRCQTSDVTYCLNN